MGCQAQNTFFRLPPAPAALPSSLRGPKPGKRYLSVFLVVGPNWVLFPPPCPDPSSGTGTYFRDFDGRYALPCPPAPEKGTYFISPALQPWGPSREYLFPVAAQNRYLFFRPLSLLCSPAAGASRSPQKGAYFGVFGGC